MHKQEKIEFRQEVRLQLKKNKRRAHTGDIVLMIHFNTTKNNPPALHTLTKNYLDLLHKEIQDDNLKALLFKDDSQIKILIANYFVNTANQKPNICITSYPYSYFIKDMELADRIHYNKFESEENYAYDVENDEDFDEDFDTSDLWDELRKMKTNREKLLNRFGEKTYNFQRFLIIRRIQEAYLKQNKINIKNFISIFDHLFSYNKKYTNDKAFQNLLDFTSRLIFHSSQFIKMGGSPKRKGETENFKYNLKEVLYAFKKKHNVLFPLYHPIYVTILYIPPFYNIPDLDNLAINIVPFINEIFQPPYSFDQIFKDFNSCKFENKLIEKLLKFLPNSIRGYQIIQIPRKESDPEEGRIDFIITDGLDINANVWDLVNHTIDKWKESFT